MLFREMPVAYRHILTKFNQDEISIGPKTNNNKKILKNWLRQTSEIDKLILLGTIKFSALYIRQSFRVYSTVAH